MNFPRVDPFDPIMTRQSRSLARSDPRPSRAMTRTTLTTPILLFSLIVNSYMTWKYQKNLQELGGSWVGGGTHVDFSVLFKYKS